MDLWEVLKVVVRRWVVVVPVLVLTSVLAVSLPPRIDPTYSASGSVVLVEPVRSTVSALNPYLALGSNTTAQALAISGDGGLARQQVTDAGNSPEFDVTQLNSRSPIVVVTAEAETPQRAVGTVEQVIGIVQTQLEERQTSAGAPIPGQISTQLLTPEVLSTPVYDGRQRVLILTLGLGVALAVALALGVEGIALVRHRRRHGVGLGPSSEMRLELVTYRMDLLDERERLLAERERLLGLHMVQLAHTPAGDLMSETKEGPFGDVDGEPDHDRGHLDDDNGGAAQSERSRRASTARPTAAGRG